MGTDIGPFSRAVDMLEALKRREISAVELAELHVARIEEFDGELNAIPLKTPERALDAAAYADTVRSRGDSGGVLLGLPMTLKESTQVAGMPQSAGIPPLAQHVPHEDGPIARSVFAAGAGLLGKTNIPFSLADFQADSPVYGRTVNPWDHSRTPGGSTGGGGAALAAGMTPLEIGSDIGGSIRVPAAYCGVYGHRPTESAIPRYGGFPFSERPNQAAVMAVQGPLARSAFDLELLFHVVAGPEAGEDAGWRLELPTPRADSLSDFRVAMMPPLTFAQPSSAMQAKQDELASFLARRGAKVDEAMPEVDQEQYFRDYLALLAMMTSQGMPKEQREQASAASDDGSVYTTAFRHGMTMDAPELLRTIDRRERAREAWRAFFADWDVLVCPTALDVAFEHVTAPQETRTLTVDGRTLPYMANIVYPMWAIYTGLPATAFPAGISPLGLPLGLQAVGPYLEDRTTLRFAQLLEQEWQAFEPPPGY